MAQFFTDFSEYTTGSFPNGADWTLRKSSENINHIDSDIISSGGYTGGQALRATNAGGSVATWDDLDGSSDVEGVVRFEFEDWTEGSFQRGANFGIAARGSNDGGNNYLAILSTLQDSSRLFIIRGATQNNGTSLGNVLFSTPSSGYVWLRFRVNNSNLKLRFWYDGDSEPSAWDIETTDTNLNSGFAGIFANMGTPEPMDWIDVDTLGVGTNGDTAPTSPVGGTAPADPTNANATLI